MKSQIRKKIEEIANIPPTIRSFDRAVSRPAWTDGSKDKKRYRLKLYQVSSVMVSKKAEEEIRKLPHVIDLNFTTSYWGGLCIYFDCRPSQIKL